MDPMRRLRAFLNRCLGDRGELAAARYLKKLGWRILARGVRVRHGEIDLIAVDDRTLVYVEVKTRRRGCPAEAVTLEKQRRLTRAARRFAHKHRLQNHPGRFDVIAITWPDDNQPPDIKHYRNAFEAYD
ncbi:MAG: YraN family protein [Planctomycetota bacterium]|nr:YraN family protein [Planctomycetota bacterium]